VKFTLTLRNPMSDLAIRDNLEPETWLPSQVPRSNGQLCLPERNMLFELLAGALHDLDSNSETIRRRATRWLVSGKYKAPFTCREVCDYLGLDHSSLRRKVKAGLRLLRSRRDSAIRHHVSDEMQFNSREIERSSTRMRQVSLDQLELFAVEAGCEPFSPCADESPEANPLNSLGVCIQLDMSPKTSETPSENGYDASARGSQNQP